MKNGLWLLALSGIVVAANAAASPCSLSALHWMKGAWHDRSATMQVEERWAIGPDDRLLGSSWLLHPGRAGGVLEAETIMSDAGTITLRIRHFDDTLAQAREDKDAPMVFLASSCAENEVVFDGQGDRAGEHITYRREGDRMRFIGDFIHQGKPIHVEETFTGE